MRHVEEVSRGLACGCRCTDCKRPLIARKGEVRVEHFAHQAGANCPADLALWHAAREVLLETAATHAETMVLPKADQARLEPAPKNAAVDPTSAQQTLTTRIPITLDARVHDVVFTGLGHRRDAHRHATDCAGALVINLRTLSPQITRGALKDAILRRAPRTWTAARQCASSRAQSTEQQPHDQRELAAHAERICDQLTQPGHAGAESLPWQALRARALNKLEASDEQWRRATIEPRIHDIQRPGTAISATAYEYAARVGTKTGTARALVVIELGEDTLKAENNRQTRYKTPTLVIHAPMSNQGHPGRVTHMHWLRIDHWQRALDERYQPFQTEEDTP
ncbi:hypothetical protein J7355_16360 [Endozoicomonas sp. G2_2]|uniref:competence protein CoiA family protein n=1 Tax=Endozoicomonas sp. G2_2 TaxID=2821092 RepID=UPI001AD96508|nr:hypothetical protein [Endozoicomonas sp. G2_2]MBO9471664.1 hypothetical protein [Endozoicomonas sp. G2_2]